MSDTSQGPGWWQASDGRWYAPEQHPNYVPPPPPPLPWGQPAPFGPSGQGPYGNAPPPDPSAITAWTDQPAPPVTSGLAIAALVLSILWIGGVGSVVGVVLGMVALSQIGASSGQKRGRSLATAGLVIGAVGLVGAVVLYSTGNVGTSHSPSSATGATPGHAQGPRTGPAAPLVLRELTDVPPSIVDQVGVPSSTLVTPPEVKAAQPKLVVDGKPGAVFIGGLFCPYCAAERWAIIMAFSRFGSFSHLKETSSSPWDVYPSTATFSFQGATYTSRYVGLAMAEHSGNDVDGLGTDAVLDPLTKQEATVWQTYDDSYGYPFLDIGNEAFVLSPSYSPALLSGLDQQNIASRLDSPNVPSTQGIVGTATYLTAAICATTGQKPLSVCGAALVTKAAQAMGLKDGVRLTARTGSLPSMDAG